MAVETKKSSGLGRGLAALIPVLTAGRINHKGGVGRLDPAQS